MSASTVQRYRPKGTGAVYPRPHVSAVAKHLAHRLVCSEKAAQSRMDRARRLLPELIAAAQEAGALDWLRWWFLEADALRHGPRLPLEPWLLAAVSGKDTDEDQLLVAMLTNPSPETRAAWLRSLEQEIVAKSELLAAAKAGAT